MDIVALIELRGSHIPTIEDSYPSFESSTACLSYTMQAIT